MNRDENDLRLLTIFHYVVGGLASLFACFPLIHLGVGLFIILAPDKLSPEQGEQIPQFIGYVFAGMGALFFIFGQLIAVSIIISGRFISKRKNYLYSFIVACISCLFMPFGTALGIFTIVVLSRESVKELYESTF